MITYTVITKSSPGAVSTGLVSVTLYIMIEGVITMMMVPILITMRKFFFIIMRLKVIKTIKIVMMVIAGKQ
jgi:hypothetical protein